MSEDNKGLPTESRSAEIDAFLNQVRKAPPRPGGGRGRLIFALDATASREPSWERACRIQGEMFEATAGLGGLEIQLVFYRGFAECKSSRWMTTAADLHRAMRSVFCVGGETQIERVLAHAIAETGRRRVNALVFVGDAMEENLDRLCGLAGQLGLLGVPVFLFHEGGDRRAGDAFHQIAKLSGGACLSFDLASADRLKELLGAVAVYAAGGYRALAAYGEKRGGAVLRLTAQLRPTRGSSPRAEDPPARGNP
ncbi:MAG: VWA domain-containing protein [Stellaceae bacterium]